jgi:hypothetical protein
VPIVHWLLHEFRNIAEENFSEQALSQSRIFNVAAVRQEWVKVKASGTHRSPRKLWVMFCFLQWCRQHKLGF